MKVAFTAKVTDEAGKMSRIDAYKSGVADYLYITRNYFQTKLMGGNYMPSWWPNAFWCIVGIVGGAIASFIISLFFFVIGRKKQLLEYQIISVDLVTKEMSGVPGMKITLNEQIVECLTSSTVKFINSGNRPILPKDFASLGQLSIAVEGHIFDSDDGYQIVSDNPISRPSITMVNNRAYISFDFIKKKQSFSITILHTGKISVLGELISGEIREIRQKNVNIISGVIGALTTIVGTLLAYTFYQNYSILVSINDEAKEVIFKVIAIIGMVLLMIYSIISSISTLFFPGFIYHFNIKRQKKRSK